MNDKYYLKSVGNALNVLDIFSQQQQALTINELVQLSDMDRASINRIIFTLLQKEYLIKFGKKYYLSDVFLQLSIAYRRSSTVGQRIKDEMTAISDKYGESTFLYRNKDEQCVLIDWYCPPGASFVRSQMLDIMPYNCSTMGKIFLSEHEDDEIRKFMDKIGFFRSTEYSICEINAFLKEIENVRANGFAFCKGEYALDTGAIGVPIHNGARHIQYVISLCFGNAMTEDNYKLIIDDLILIGKRLSLYLSSAEKG